MSHRSLFYCWQKKSTNKYMYVHCFWLNNKTFHYVIALITYLRETTHHSFLSLFMTHHRIRLLWKPKMLLPSLIKRTTFFRWRLITLWHHPFVEHIFYKKPVQIPKIKCIKHEQQKNGCSEFRLLDRQYFFYFHTMQL